MLTLRPNDDDPLSPLRVCELERDAMIGVPGARY